MRGMTGAWGALAAGWLLLGLAGHAAAAEPPHRDDPAIIESLAKLDERTGLLLPAVRVECGELKLYDMHKYGPGQRDYCNRMPYAPDRQTALYAGGNHQVPHRMNDVWEFHLGSNTWHLLYAPDGGNAGAHKAAYFLTSRNLVKDPAMALSDDQRRQIEGYRQWWQQNVVFRDGHLETTRGGPIMPSHTWDAFTYDEKTGMLLWGMGASSAGQISTHAYYNGRPIAEIEKQEDGTYTPMWMFDPAARRWSHYRTPGEHAALRGMGATMAYLPDRGQSLWYVAAQNVSPAAYEMWLFDGVNDKWTELKPNGGKSIGTLATKEKVAPMSEQQTAYSPKASKLVAVLGPDTFVYDVAANQWSKAVTDDRIHGHDAHSVFVYDSKADVFLLAFPPGGRGKQLKLAAYSLETNKWEVLDPRGDPIPAPQYGSHMGYYDSRLNALVIQGRGMNRVWVYRHGK